MYQVKIVGNFLMFQRPNSSCSSGQPLDDCHSDMDHTPFAPSSSDFDGDCGTNGKTYITCSIAVIVMNFLHCKYVISV